MNSEKKLKKVAIPLNKFLTENYTKEEIAEINAGAERIILAQKVREFRKLKNITSEELAKASSVSYKTISKIENKKPVKFDTVVKVLNCLGLKITYSLY